jgi:hypothetical protein
MPWIQLQEKKAALPQLLVCMLVGDQRSMLIRLIVASVAVFLLAINSIGHGPNMVEDTGHYPVADPGTCGTDEEVRKWAVSSQNGKFHP